MPTVTYTDTNNLMWAVLVMEGTPETEYESGAILGPPDLTSLGLSKKQTALLHNTLVENGLYYAPLLMGKRALLKTILAELSIDVDVRTILSLFQRDYYGEQE